MCVVISASAFLAAWLMPVVLSYRLQLKLPSHALKPKHINEVYPVSQAFPEAWDVEQNTL